MKPDVTDTLRHFVDRGRAAQEGADRAVAAAAGPAPSLAPSDATVESLTEAVRALLVLLHEPHAGVLVGEVPATCKHGGCLLARDIVKLAGGSEPRGAGASRALAELDRRELQVEWLEMRQLLERALHVGSLDAGDIQRLVDDVAAQLEDRP